MTEKCPRCESSNIMERDCIACDGEGQFDYGELEFCEVCQGNGYIKGSFECMACLHEWED